MLWHRFGTKGFQAFMTMQEKADESTRHEQAAHPTKTHWFLFFFFPFLWWPIRGLRQGAGGERMAQPAPWHHPLSLLPPDNRISKLFSLFRTLCYIRPCTAVRLHTLPCWINDRSVCLARLPLLTKCQTENRVESQLEACV